MYNLIADKYIISNTGEFDDIAKNPLENDFYNKLYNNEYNSYNYQQNNYNNNNYSISNYYTKPNLFRFFNFRNKLLNYFMVIIIFLSKYTKLKVYRKYQVYFFIQNKLFKHLYIKHN